MALGQVILDQSVLAADAARITEDRIGIEHVMKNIDEKANVDRMSGNGRCWPS